MIPRHLQFSSFMALSTYTIIFWYLVPLKVRVHTSWGQALPFLPYCCAPSSHGIMAPVKVCWTNEWTYDQSTGTQKDNPVATWSEAPTGRTLWWLDPVVAPFHQGGKEDHRRDRGSPSLLWSQGMCASGNHFSSSFFMQILNPSA